MKLRSTLSIIVAIIAAAIAAWLFVDAVTWMSGFKRYTIFLERVFNTSESLANTMHIVQASVAIAIGAACIKALTWPKDRARQD
jgi:hypothetical protein